MALSSCASVCGVASEGILVGGFCWYEGGDNESCTTVCTGRGGYNDATRTYAGSDGSVANCNAVKLAFGANTSGTSGSLPGIGCNARFDGRFRGITDTGTTDESTASTSGYNRYCACNN